MEQTLLTADQRIVLARVGREPNLSSFYLSGGTALAAFHLGHRVSDDLDFFSEPPPDPIFLHAFGEDLRRTLGRQSTSYERVYDRHLFQFAGPGGVLKVEFAHYPFPCFEAPSAKDGMRIDGLRDIAANKLMALMDRFEPKDFVDLFFIFERRTLAEVLADAEAKFRVHLDPIVLGGELAKVRRVQALPRMVVDLSIKDLKSRFTGLAKQLAPSILQ